MSPVVQYAVQTSVTLLAVAALAGLILYAGRRWSLRTPSGPLELLGRLQVDPRRAVYVVRVAQRVLVVGGGDHGLQLLVELRPEEVPTSWKTTNQKRFADLLTHRPRPDVAVPATTEESSR